MGDALDRIGRALDKAYENYCRRQAIIDNLAAPSGGFFNAPPLAPTVYAEMGPYAAELLPGTRTRH
jgi:hypothetical protein